MQKRLILKRVIKMLNCNYKVFLSCFFLLQSAHAATVKSKPASITVLQSSSTAVPALSNPITLALTGSHNTYNVGPSQTYTEPDNVPWGSLQAGDVVNIYYRSTAYKWKLCLRAKGTATNPVIINGVTDKSGNRPQFDFKGAKTASGCNPGGNNNIFNTSSQYSLEDYAGIIIKAGASDAFGYKPQYIQIKNLELYGAAKGNTFISLMGTTMTYGDSAGIWIQPSADILIENNVIYDNAFGLFTMAKNGTLTEACERIIARNNRVFGNGVVNNYFDHNFYMQSTNPIVEGNYIGQTRSGSEGSSYKSRSSGEIFRYNYVVASSRAIDLVHAEDQSEGIAAQSDYGKDYVYGNIIVNDCSLSICASNPIHYGGDNLGEQENVSTIFTPTSKYRSNLYFYNNTVVNKVKLSQSYRTHIFDLSLVGTTVEAWNNIFYLEGDSNFSWLESSGILNLKGTNLVSVISPSLTNGDMNSIESNLKVNQQGQLLSSDPLMVNSAGQDYHLKPTSPAIDKSTATPTAINISTTYADLPVSLQPILQSNGKQLRTVKGQALDLGALESN